LLLLLLFAWIDFRSQTLWIFSMNNRARIDVQVWLWLVTAHRMYLFQEWTSSYGILFGVSYEAPGACLTAL
jgi:hypothetical protein